MGFGSNKPKSPPPLPPPPTHVDATEEGDAERIKQRKKKGRKSTILTSSQGVKKKTVLG